MAHKGNPILGDSLYGGNQKLEVPRQMLHAWKISIPHPQTGEMMSFEAPLPPDFTAIMDLIS
jgi:23S rRNA pseudouridine1911/1915/1917 synthase